MNILFVSCDHNMFDKIDCGAAARSTMFVKALTQLGHVDVVSFSNEQFKSNIPNCEVVFGEHIKPTFGIKDKIRIRILYLLRPYSPYSYYMCDRKRESVVSRQYSQKRYDLIACRYIGEAVSCGLLNYSDKLVVDNDDNLVSAFRRNARKPNLKLDLRIELLVKSLFVGQMSKRVLSKVRCSFYSNINELPYKQSVFLHNVPSITVKLPVIQQGSPKRVLFVGWLDYFPNRSGLVHFVSNVFPLIQKQIPDVEFHIAGRTTDEKLISHLQTVVGIKYLGYVANIDDEYEHCRVIIVPVYQGAGTSVKFVEGLFTNRPLVSTPMGVRGFDEICQDKVHYMLARTDEEFANRTIELLNSVEKANEMAHHAYEVGMANYSQERFFDIVKTAITSINNEQ